MSITIDEVENVPAVWPELLPLVSGMLEFHEPLGLPELKPDWPDLMLDAFASPREAVVLMARDETGKAVGFLNGSLNRGVGIFAATTTFLENAYVEQGDRTHGVGSALLSRFEDWSRANGATEVRLTVMAANQLAAEFWSHRGFKVDRQVMHKELT